MVDETTEERTECISCAPDDKAPAAYRWHPGTVGVHPLCVEHAKEDLVDEEDLSEFERDKEPVSGYLTPMDGGPKIRTWSDWNNYQEEVNG